MFKNDETLVGKYLWKERQHSRQIRNILHQENPPKDKLIISMELHAEIYYEATVIQKESWEHYSKICSMHSF